MENMNFKKKCRGKCSNALIILSLQFQQKDTFIAEDSIMSETEVIFQEIVFRI